VFVRNSALLENELLPAFRGLSGIPGFLPSDDLQACYLGAQRNRRAQLSDDVVQFCGMFEVTASERRCIEMGMKSTAAIMSSNRVVLQPQPPGLSACVSVAVLCAPNRCGQNFHPNMTSL